MSHLISNGPILELCIEAERHPGAWVEKRWWDQEGIDLAGVWEEAVAGRLEEVEGPQNNEEE